MYKLEALVKVLQNPRRRSLTNIIAYFNVDFLLTLSSVYFAVLLIYANANWFLFLSTWDMMVLNNLMEDLVISILDIYHPLVHLDVITPEIRSTRFLQLIK